ncbi:hypothetical protein Syun_001673 [Stephania yunnanensis]|uniref:Uncharacterized protein n=1 Tax=Stephania yunnanensis TaxID=152371 RepID=A0AAP0LF95_9MAGN
MEGLGIGVSKHGGSSLLFFGVLTHTFETTPTVKDLYLHLYTVNHDEAQFQSRRLEPTQGTPDQSVDDAAVYYDVVGDYPKGCVYSLKSLGRKKKRYAYHEPVQDDHGQSGPISSTTTTTS